MSIVFELARLGNRIDSASTGEFLSKDLNTTKFDAIPYSSITGKPTILDSALSSQLIDSSYVQLRQTVSGGGLDSALTTQLIDSSYVAARASAASSGYQLYEYTATQGQTTFQDSDLSGNVLSYTSGGTLVYYNGVLMGPDDVTSTTGSSVVLASGADSGSHVAIAKWTIAGEGGGSSITWGGDRAVQQYGTSLGSATLNYYDITTPGNASSFGNLSQGRHYNGALSNAVRVVWAGGYVDDTTQYVDTIDFVDAATTGNASDFGNLSANSQQYTSGTSNGTRGIWTCMFQSNVIEYITVATEGNSTDFGDLTGGGFKGATESNGSRGVIFRYNGIDYVTIDTTGNATSFGSPLTNAHERGSGSDGTYALVGGGNDTINNIEYITTATAGNGTDFGDLSAARREISGTHNATRVCFNGGRPSSGTTNIIEYVTTATPGNATDFGDLLASTGSMRSGAGAAAS